MVETARITQVQPIGAETRRRLLLSAREGRPAPELVDFIRSAIARVRVAVIGRVVAVWAGALGGGPVLYCSIADDTGELMLLFLGRSRAPELCAGRPVLAAGTIGLRDGRPVMINPLVTVVAE